MGFDDSSASTLLGAERRAAAKPRGRTLLVIGEGGARSYPLPAEGRITAGRSSKTTLCLDDPLVSREHVAIHVGETVEVEDLGSANGTRLREEPLAPGERVPVSPGQVIEVGTTMIVLQAAPLVPRGHRLWPHTHFEVRLEEACEAGQPFSVLRVHAGGEAFASAARELLEPGDLVALYAPGEYELLVMGARAGDVAAAVVEQIPGARVGIASYPSAGRTAEALIERACARVRSGGPDGSFAAGADLPDGVVLAEGSPLRDLVRVARRVAKGNLGVLLLGETGAGKEIFAEIIHRASPRRDKPFVRLNCAALSETLLESELFGHERGAFTGAQAAKQGLLETADGGTIFLDEVGELPLALQAKLLRVIEQKQVLRVGALKPRSFDARFVSATNRDLEGEVAAGKFRPDLFFRLNGISLVIPPLRERTQEIGPIARSFLARVATELGLERAPRISEKAMERLVAYPWPGNVRELRNVTERAVLLCTDDEIGPEHLPVERMSVAREPTAPPPVEADDQRARIVRALEQCGGNQTRAAQLLGVSRRTLTTWLNKHELPRPKKTI